MKRQRPLRRPPSRGQPAWEATGPALRFSPTAWAKLLYLRDAGDTEVGGFGISDAEDLLYVVDVQLIRQACSAVSVVFQDESVADFFDAQVDQGRQPEQFARLWVHTHPANSARPSHVDEETFQQVFGATDWSVMMILAQGGQTYARLQFRAGPGGDVLLPVQVDYSSPFAGSDRAAWQAEYEANVTAQEPFGQHGLAGIPDEVLLEVPRGVCWEDPWDERLEEAAGGQLILERGYDDFDF